MKIINLNFFTYTQCSFSLALNHFLELLPFTITYIFLQGDNNRLFVPILSLACSFYILAFGYLPGFEEAIGLRCSIAFAQQDYYKFVVRFWRLGFINLLMLGFSVLMVIRADALLVLLELPEGLTTHISTFCKCLLGAKIIENFSNLGKGVLIAQRIYSPFILINATSLVVFIAIDFVLVCRFRMNIYGFLIAYYAKMIVELIMVIYTVKKFSHPNLFQIPKFLDVTQGLVAETKNTCCIIFSVYGEWFADEVYTVFAARTGNLNNIYVWTLFMNLWLYIYYIIMGLNGCMRTFTSSAIGNLSGVKRTMVQCGIYAATIIGIISILLATFSDHLASVFASDINVYSTLALCLRLYSLVIFWDCGFASLSTVAKLIEKTEIQFIVGAVIYPICSIFYGYLFCFGFGLEVIGLELGLLFTTATCAILLCFTIKTQLPVFEKKLSASNLEETEGSVEESLIEMETKMVRTRKKFVLNSH